MVGENGGAGDPVSSLQQNFCEVATVENIVAKNQCAWAVSDKIPADNERLRKAIGGGLHRILDLHAPLGTVAEQRLEARGVLRS